MTCEDYEDHDDRNRPGAIERLALRLAPLLDSRPIHVATRVLPKDVRKAIVTVLPTVANILRRRLIDEVLRSPLAWM